jgi:hypothetical protein
MRKAILACLAAVGFVRSSWRYGLRFITRAFGPLLFSSEDKQSAPVLFFSPSCQSSSALKRRRLYRGSSSARASLVHFSFARSLYDSITVLFVIFGSFSSSASASSFASSFGVFTPFKPSMFKPLK